MIYVGYDPARPELVKIGYTTNLKRRRSTSRTTNPEYQTIKEISGSRVDETELKKRFRKYRAFEHVQEWFFFRGEVRDWVFGDELEVPKDVYKGYQAWVLEDYRHWYTRLHELARISLDTRWEEGFIQKMFLMFCGWEDRRFPPPFYSSPTSKQIDKIHEIFNERKAHV